MCWVLQVCYFINKMKECYRLKSLCALQNLYVDILTPNMMVLEGTAYGS
jgi:hypothetical protein